MELKTLHTHRVPVRYFEGGSGTPLVFLHGAGGILPADQFLDRLAKKYRVYAPLLPGYGDSEECASLRDMLDVTLHTLDVIAGLGLEDPLLAGHSMGGMIAAEMAALAPNDFSHLALIASAGLWLDEHPIPDLFATLPYELPAVLFHDVEMGTKLLTSGLALNDPEWLKGFLVQNARQMGMAGKILFPVPDRGLGERLYRIKAKTLLVWGASDKLIPPVYGEAFKRAIANAQLTIIPKAGHMITLEQPDELVSALNWLTL
jgi:pimeloyl-ACP methyl ester carboxylesterase